MTRLLIVLVAILVVPIYAQEDPAVDEDLLALSRLNVQLAEKSVVLAESALKNTPEYVAYEDARRVLDQVKQGIQSMAAKRYPGYEMDLKTWKLVPHQATK